MAARAYPVIVEKDEDGWFVGSVSELPGCHTQAKTVEELRGRMREAIRAYLGNNEVPKGVTFVGVETLEV